MKDQSCYFEHRNTGVDGMYQGQISLTGMELEIADAAATAGFNTWQHIALYDLIWAVKRVAFQHCQTDSRPPKPKDPLYPDRYRPSGLGDTTSKKRLRPFPNRLFPTTIKLEDRIVVPKVPKNNRRNKKSLKDTVVPPVPLTVKRGFSEHGTRDDPIELVSNDEEEEGATSKKRKLNTGGAKNNGHEANQSRLRATASTYHPHASAGTVAHENHLHTAADNAQRNVSGGVFTQQHDFVPLDNLGKGNQPDARACNTGQPQVVKRQYPARLPSKGNNVPVQLHVVRNKLNVVERDIQTCRNIMRDAFNLCADRLNRDETIDDMARLNEQFTKVEDAVADGVDCIDRVKNVLSQI
ncbi:hypothetical protein LTS08_000118 [Lithohypha guttulata]|nr:hypothetical protein LTS08_000118 [Lithohypha guttulata]